MSRTEGKPGMNIGAPQRVAPVEGNPAAEALAALGGARGMTQTRTQYQTAITVQVPRDLEVIRARVIQEATYSRDGFFYAWTQNDKSSTTGTSTIEGTSIDGAMILLRNWGNAVCEPDLVDESPTHWMLRATFIDLETGFTSARLFRQRKSQKIGKHDAERSLDIQFQIGQSKAIRNSVVRCVPQWLVDEALEAAKAAAAKRFQDVATHAARAVRAYEAEYKVTLAQLERKLGKKRPDWVPADLVLLNAIFRALKEGQTSVGQEFSSDEPEEPETPAKAADVPPGEDMGDASVYDTKPEPKPAADPPPAAASQPATPPAAAAEPKPEPAAVPAAEPAQEPKAKEPPAPDFQPPTKKK